MEKSKEQLLEDSIVRLIFKNLRKTPDEATILEAHKALIKLYKKDKSVLDKYGLEPKFGDIHVEVVIGNMKFSNEYRGENSLLERNLDFIKYLSYTQLDLPDMGEITDQVRVRMSEPLTSATEIIREVTEMYKIK